MSWTNCASCGVDIEGHVYSDGGVLEISHGGGQCKECYLKGGHKECPECKALAYDHTKFCSECGRSYA